ncbi:hypothetical protein BpHYR1_008403, partial [Brachionus plicatilis]
KKLSSLQLRKQYFKKKSINLSYKKNRPYNIRKLISFLPISEIISWRTVSQEKFFLKPCWLWKKILFESKYRLQINLQAVVQKFLQGFLNSNAASKNTNKSLNKFLSDNRLLNPRFCKPKIQNKKKKKFTKNNSNIVIVSPLYEICSTYLSIFKIVQSLELFYTNLYKIVLFTESLISISSTFLINGSDPTQRMIFFTPFVNQQASVHVMKTD